MRGGDADDVRQMMELEFFLTATNTRTRNECCLT